MGSNSSMLLQKDEIESLAVESGFNSKQIKRLYNRFTSLDKDGKGYLTRQDFHRIPELHVNPLCDRLIEVLVDDYGGDEGKLNFKKFVAVFSVFRRRDKLAALPAPSVGVGSDAVESPANSKERKLRFLFGIYDKNKDDKIDKDELLSILKMLVGSNIAEDQLKGIAERTITELDENGDMVITFQEFCETLKKIDVDEKMSMKFLT